ncbi:MAG: hypothetical protein LBF95_03385 [Treponema sp.]|jgi:hypothetical protein|nr:hypothetical protein [Treponema sp.]
MRGLKSGIGTRRESGLHRALKFHYGGQNGRIEQACGDYVCDCVTGEGEIVEVQTGSFGPLREKVTNLLSRHRVRIVYPVIVTAYIETYNTEALLLRRRRSPRRGGPWDLFKGLLYAPELPLLKGLTVELALIDALERRVQDGKGSWRRGGTSITGRELSGWHESIILKKPRDYRRFIPAALHGDFTVCSLAKSAGISEALARKTLYVLAKLGVVERTGNQGRFYSYRAVEAARIPKPRPAAANPARGD